MYQLNRMVRHPLALRGRCGVWGAFAARIRGACSPFRQEAAPSRGTFSSGRVCARVSRVPCVTMARPACACVARVREFGDACMNSFPIHPFAYGRVHARAHSTRDADCSLREAPRLLPRNSENRWRLITCLPSKGSRLTRPSPLTSSQTSSLSSRTKRCCVCIASRIDDAGHTSFS